MSKVAVITDTHAGIKNGADVFLDYAEKFYSEIFFPYCQKNNISNILHLGDYYDHRRIANIKVLHRVRQMFQEKLDEYDMTMDIIPGNHDVAFKNTNALSSLVETLQHYTDRVNLHMEPTVVQYDNLRVALIPWINAENKEEVMEFVSNVDAPFLGGHLELAGFEMMKGVPINSHGMSSTPFSRFETVMSGHYHTKSTRENIHYLGVPFEQTWSDCNDAKYFHVIDTDTRELTPIRNPLTIYNRVVYDDSKCKETDDFLKAHKGSDNVIDSFVKVIVANKKNPYNFDRYVDHLMSQNPFDLKIVENFEDALVDKATEGEQEIVDTQTLLNTYVDDIELSCDKERLKKKLQELFVEAQNFEAV